MRDFIKKALTKTVAVKGSRGRTEYVESPPNQKLVLGIYFAIAGLIGLIALQIAHLAVLKQWNSEIFAAITGLIGTILGVVFGQKAG